MVSRRKLLASGLAAFCFLLVGCGERKPVVLAAASLEPWIRASHAQLQYLDFSFGGSHALVEQVRQGAPADVLLLADLPRVPLPEFSSPRAFASNRLVLVARGRACTQAELAHARVAMGDPQFAPIGVYGREALQALGQWDQLGSRLVLTRDDSAALLLLSSGHVDLALVYSSDLVNRPELGPPCELPSQRPVLYYQMVRQRPSGRVVVFMEWLQEPSGLDALRAAGFSPPPKGQ